MYGKSNGKAPSCLDEPSKDTNHVYLAKNILVMCEQMKIWIKVKGERMVNALPASIWRTERVCFGVLSFAGSWATAGGLVHRYVQLEESNSSLIHSTHKKKKKKQLCHTHTNSTPEGLSSETDRPFDSSLPFYNYKMSLDDALYNFIQGRVIRLVIYLCLGDGEGGDVFTQ